MRTRNNKPVTQTPVSTVQASALMSKQAAALSSLFVGKSQGPGGAPKQSVPTRDVTSPKKSPRKSRQPSESEGEEDDDEESLLDDEELIQELRTENEDLKNRVQKCEQEMKEQNDRMTEKYEALVRTLRIEKDSLPSLLRDLVMAARMPPTTRYYSDELIAFCKKVYTKDPQLYETMRFDGIVFPDLQTLYKPKEETEESRGENGQSTVLELIPAGTPIAQTATASNGVAQPIVAQKPIKPEIKYVNPVAAAQQLAEEKRRASHKRKRAHSREEDDTEESDEGSFKSDPSDLYIEEEDKSETSDLCHKPAAKKTPIPRKLVPKIRFTAEQVAALKQSFSESTFPKREEIDKLAQDLVCDKKRIQNWFINERAKGKRPPTLTKS